MQNLQDKVEFKKRESNHYSGEVTMTSDDPLSMRETCKLQAKSGAVPHSH